MEKVAKAVMPWIPLLIAAGYFLYLTLSWQKYTTFLHDVEVKLDAKLAGFGIDSSGNNSHTNTDIVVPARDGTDTISG